MVLQALGWCLALLCVLAPRWAAAQGPPAPPTLEERQKRCDRGETLMCFGLGRTLITGVFVEIEDARLSYDASVTERTGLRGGWGVGFRGGIDLFDWVPLRLGVRHASPNDDRGFSEQVVRCTQTPGGLPECDDTPHSVSTSTGTALYSGEVGLMPSVRLGRAWALSPGFMLGYTGMFGSYTRSVTECVDCTEVTVPVRARGAYLAPTIKLTWLVFGLSLRYERFLSGDLRDGVAIGFVFGPLYKAVGLPLPGEPE